MRPRVERSEAGISVEADTYRLDIRRGEPIATLVAVDGSAPMRLFLLAALDTDRGLDGTVACAEPDVVEADDGVTIIVDTQSTTWDTKRVRLECTAEEVSFGVEVSGRGSLTDVRLLGGPYTGNPRWGGGTFHSQWSATTLFSSSPDDPRRVVAPASEPAAIGVVGGSLPGRGHWFFTPAPLLFAGTPMRTEEASVAEPGSAAWQTLELRCAVDAATFSELRYAPFLGGFSIELSYEGETVVDGTFHSPPLVIRLGVPDPYAALRTHADALRSAGSAPVVTRVRPAWWTEPIFCGWGEQCRQASLEGGSAPSQSTRAGYDAWLATLEANGVHPGTIVIDDKWQRTYGRNEVDETRWPDLRTWIADHRARGQRVLLWFKAWDPEGLPADACITDRRGNAIAADPSSATYRAILRRSLEDMLGSGGLGADGLKVDFTAQTPSGPGLVRAGGPWGIALLHRLLSLVYTEAKRVNPEALVVTHAASPLFTDVTDMVRLNDLMRLSDSEPFTPAVPQMRHRALIAASIEPGMLIDTDDWCMPSKAEWRAYLDVKPELGVPALYYATGIDHTGEAFDAEDYAAIVRAWDRWREHR